MPDQRSSVNHFEKAGETGEPNDRDDNHISPLAVLPRPAAKLLLE